jgi:hypothetical protein
MKLLSPSECSVWLKSEDCCKTPYRRAGISADSYLQFAIPKTSAGVARMVDGIRTFLGSPRTCLFQVSDWSRYSELENSILSELESASPGELQPFDTFGILFDPGEADEMFECCIGVVNCGMSAYLYAPRIAIFLIWEGDLVDVWTNGSELRNRLAQWLRSEQFRLTRF